MVYDDPIYGPRPIVEPLLVDLLGSAADDKSLQQLTV